MAHTSIYSLIERLRTLEQLQMRRLGELGPQILVCAVCSALHDTRGCPCGREAWTPIVVAIAELELTLSENQRTLQSA